MTATLDDELAELRRVNSELQQRLDEALDGEAATAEAWQVVNNGLLANEERHSLVTQAIAEGIYDWDIGTNALWVSARLIEIFGLTGGSLSAADWNERVHPDDFEHYRTGLRGSFKGLTPRLDCEYRVRHGDGQYRWIEDRGVPVRDSTGRAIRMVGAITDITERKESERALRELLDQQTATAEVLQVINSSPGQSHSGFRRNAGESDATVRRCLRSYAGL